MRPQRAWLLPASLLLVAGLVGCADKPESIVEDPKAVRMSPKNDVDGIRPLEYVWIKPGTFMMGSPEDEPDRGPIEPPQHRVTLTDGFYLGKCEATQAQYEEVMGENPSQCKDEGSNAPVETVTWHDALEFCRRLTPSPITAGLLTLVKTGNSHANDDADS